MRGARLVLGLLLLLLPAAAGCLTPSDTAVGEQQVGPLPLPLDLPTFTPLKIIDDVRPGGEPVITITPKGTILVSAHPGPTHTRLPPSPGLLSNAAAQSYIWRSEDGGATFTPLNLAGPAGPAGPWAGVSDPDFAIDANGRVYFTDLGPLTHASLAWSDDEGKTWMANPVASAVGGAPTDRQWLATHGTDVYFSSNYFTSQKLLKSTDGGLTWAMVGEPNCGSDLIADSKGVLYAGCGKEFLAALDVSEDGGATWTMREVPGATEIFRTLAEPAVDANDTVYITWTQEDGVYYSSTKDKGVTWTTPFELTKHVAPNGTGLWPWIVAGDGGRIAVAWMGLYEDEDPSVATGDWHIFMALLTGADTENPQVYAVQATDAPIHQGAICQNGTVCQLPEPSPTSGDRRLGDFFEIAVDPEGYVHAVFAVTTAGDSISHPGYVKQTAGPKVYLTPRTLAGGHH